MYVYMEGGYLSRYVQNEAHAMMMALMYIHMARCVLVQACFPAVNL